MENNTKTLTPPDTDPSCGTPERKSGRRLLLCFAVCLLLAASILLTYTLTSAARRREYTEQLAAKQQELDRLVASQSDGAQNLQLLGRFLEMYSYYADTMDEQEMLQAAFRAYVSASGDNYAQYYTEEEYLAMQQENAGDYCGIGVTVTNTTAEIEGREYKVFRVGEINPQSEAIAAGMKIGDLIYAVEREGVFDTVNSIGFDAALQAVRGEEGTVVSVRVFREEAGVFLSHDISVVRRHYETQSVRGELSEADPTVGIVRISGFDLTTPRQFKEQVNALLSAGVEHFVFDVRSNPGGDLRSIKAVLSYFLQDGDLILEAIDKDGKVAASYKAEVSVLTGDYAGCSVAAEELGMYAGLDMVVLCNNATASAAEVFVATLRDYGLARTVGKTTFGKGIMQTTARIPFRETVAYVKLTTHAYVTKCGISYHGSGIVPDVGVDLSEEAQKYSPSLLPQSMDQQLRTALTLFS